VRKTPLKHGSLTQACWHRHFGPWFASPTASWINLASAASMALAPGTETGDRGSRLRATAVGTWKTASGMRLRILPAMVDKGRLLDGVSGRKTARVNGLPWDDSAAVLRSWFSLPGPANPK